MKELSDTKKEDNDTIELIRKQKGDIKKLLDEKLKKIKDLEDKITGLENDKNQESEVFMIKEKALKNKCDELEKDKDNKIKNLEENLANTEEALKDDLNKNLELDKKLKEITDAKDKADNDYKKKQQEYEDTIEKLKGDIDKLTKENEKLVKDHELREKELTNKYEQIIKDNN